MPSMPERNPRRVGAALTGGLPERNPQRVGGGIGSLLTGLGSQLGSLFNMPQAQPAAPDLPPADPAARGAYYRGLNEKLPGAEDLRPDYHVFGEDVINLLDQEFSPSEDDMEEFFASPQGNYVSRNMDEMNGLTQEFIPYVLDAYQNWLETRGKQSSTHPKESSNG